MPVDLSTGIVPVFYRDVFEILNTHGLAKLTMDLFISLFESAKLSTTILAQIWDLSCPKGKPLTRADFYKCLTFIALAQQGKSIDERLLDNYTNKELPIPMIGDINDLGDRFIRLMRDNQCETILCFRYGDLCSLDTIQVELVPDKKGVLFRHFEYEVSSMRLKNKVFRRYNDFDALNTILSQKYANRILPNLPPKKLVNQDKEFIEDRRRALKRYLQILCRHPTLYDSEVIKFFLTFQGTDCGDNMKIQFRNALDEYSSHTSTVQYDNTNLQADSLKLFKASQIHINFIHQTIVQIRSGLQNYNKQSMKNAETFYSIEKQIQSLSTDTTEVDRWALGVNEYWSTIQKGLSQLPMELNAVAERITEQYKREDELISDHIDMLIDLLQGYKDLCKRFEIALANEQKTVQKLTNQRRSNTITSGTKSLDETLEKTEARLSEHENILQEIEKRNTHALKCVQLETQLVYANIESFIYILSSFGNSQLKLHGDLLQVWRAFCPKVSIIAQSYITNQTTANNTFK